MTLDEFYQKYNGQKIDFDGMYQNQCKDLFSFYNRDVVGNPDYVWGNAWELFDNAPNEYYEKLTGIVPQKGDVVIWNKSYGGYGHVGIVMDANSQGMLVFSQNHTGNLDPCELTNYNYSYIKGYLRPKKSEVFMKYPLFGNKPDGKVYFLVNTYSKDNVLIPVKNDKDLRDNFGLDPIIDWKDDVWVAGVPVDTMITQDVPVCDECPTTVQESPEITQEPSKSIAEWFKDFISKIFRKE